MNTYVELWDTDCGNLLGDFATLEEAVDYLASLVVTRGPSVLAGLFLLGDAEDAEPIADGDLLRLVTMHTGASPIPA